MSIIGSQFKINVHLEPINDIHLDSCSFVCTFFTSSNKYITIDKKDMKKVDEDNYVALIDSSLLSVGNIKMTINIDIPDKDFPSGYRKEIKTVNTNIVICAKDV